MPGFLLKSLLSLVLLASACAGLFTMFELFGRVERRFAVPRMKSFHRVAAAVYMIALGVITWLCIDFILRTRVDLSPRAVVHSSLALLVIALIAVKVLVVRVYRQFYDLARSFGIALVIITFVMVGISGGYYLILTKFGTEKAFQRMTAAERSGTSAAHRSGVTVDAADVDRGRVLFAEKCAVCHDPLSTKTLVGPGLKGILSSPVLPVSRRPATAENIRRQLRHPIGKMPSFSSLGEEEVSGIVAYLATL